MGPAWSLHYKMKNKKYHTVVTIPKSHRKIVERRKIDTFATQIHDPPLSWLGTGTSPNSGKAEIVLWFLLLQKKCMYCQTYLSTFESIYYKYVLP